MVVVPKSDGSLQVCINFSQVNFDIVNYFYNMHKIKDQINAMGGPRCLRRLTLKRSTSVTLVSEFKISHTILNAQWAVLMEISPVGDEDCGGGLPAGDEPDSLGLAASIRSRLINDITIYNPSLE